MTEKENLNRVDSTRSNLNRVSDKEAKSRVIIVASVFIFFCILQLHNGFSTALTFILLILLLKTVTSIK